jgi:hypothetical protein
MPVALDRHQIDLIARSVVSGRRGLGPRADRLANASAALLTNRLQAMGARGARRPGRAARRPAPSLSLAPPLVRRIVERACKHLDALAAKEALRPRDRAQAS